MIPSPRQQFTVPFGLALLVAAASFYAIYDGPSIPRVNVRWSDQVTQSQREALEAAYHLAEPVFTEGRTWRYALLDTSTDNIRRLVRDPASADTHMIDRSTFELTDRPRGPLLVLFRSLVLSSIISVVVVFGFVRLRRSTERLSRAARRLAQLTTQRPSFAVTGIIIITCAPFYFVVASIVEGPGNTAAVFTLLAVQVSCVISVLYLLRHTLWRHMACNIRLTVTLFLLFVLSYCLYYYIGSSLTHRMRMDELFQMDTPRAVAYLTEPHRTLDRVQLHPLYVLFFGPAGFTLTLAHEFFREHESFREAAVMVTALKAAAANIMACVALRLILGRDRTRLCIVLTGLFAVSMSQMILGAVPDSASDNFGTSFLYMVFAYSVVRQKLHFWPWLLAGVFALGFVITNFAQALICYSLLAVTIYGIKRAHLAVATYALGVSAVVVGLVSIQGLIYDTGSMLQLISSIPDERASATLDAWNEPSRFLYGLFGNFLVINVVGQVPNDLIVGQSELRATFTGDTRFLDSGKVALVLWLSTLVLALRNISSLSREKKLFVLGLSLCFLGNLVLHFFYVGTRGSPEYFLYTGNITCLLLLMVAIQIDRYKYIYFPLGISVLTILANNLEVAQMIWSRVPRPF